MKARFINESFNDFQRISDIIQYTRKPISLEEIKDTVIEPYSEDGRFIADWLDNLHFEEDYILPEDLKYAKLPEHLRDKPFICDGEDGRTYVVDSSGYDYPRYVASITE